VTINDAKALANKYNLDGVVIIGFDFEDETMPAVSYGRKRALCETMGRIMDRILELIDQEEIEP